MIRVRVVLAGGSGPGTEGLAAALRASPAIDACEVVTEVVTGAGEPVPAGGWAPDVLVYAGGWRGRFAGDGLPDPDDARRVLGAAARSGVRRLVVVSSAAVHEPSHHHPGMVREEADGPGALPARHGNAVSAAWRGLEVLARDLVERQVGPPAELTILRPAPVALAGGRDPICRRLTGRSRGDLAGSARRPAGRWVVTVAGFDPPIQLLAPEDLGAAVRCAVEAERAGVFHVAPRAVVTVHRAVRAAGARRLPVPRWVQRAAARLRPGPAGLRAVRADAVEFLRHPWTVSGESIDRELGFRPRHSSSEAVARLGGGRRGAPPPAEDDPDDFGLDPAYVERWSRRLFRRVHELYWRVELAGLEHLPRDGPAVLVGVHRGFMPFDGVMTLHAVLRETGRIPRFLIHPSLVKFPVLAPFMQRLGGVYASRDNAERILRRGGLLGVYPEGIRGAFTPYRRAYRLGSFGRYEFVRMALACRAPVIPFVTVGSAEIFPILGRLDWRWFRRWTEWPYLPLTPTFPLLPLPLPSKWHTRFLEPLPVQELHPPEAASDPAVVRELGRGIRRRMAEAIEEIVRRRPSAFYGDVFERPDRAR